MEPGYRLPDSIECKNQATDAVFHPEKSFIAVGDIAGDIVLYSYNTDVEKPSAVSELRALQNHKKSVRCVRVTADGVHLFSASKDKSWCHVDLETGQPVNKKPKAHESAIFSLEVVDHNVILSGDEDGCIKMWDMRRLPNPVAEFSENEDFISDIVIHEDKKHLLVTSGDGTLSCFNIKNKKMELQSELFDSEFLCLAIMKDGSKVVCGDGDGTLQIFNWGEWGNISDRYPGHPSSIDCMLPLSNDFLISGCMDGAIRLVHILPNSIEKVIGSHGDFPIQSISINHDGTLLATSSHDEYIKFWNVPDIDEIAVSSHKKRAAKNLNHNERIAERKAFFSDL